MTRRLCQLSIHCLSARNVPFNICSLLDNRIRVSLSPLQWAQCEDFLVDRGHWWDTERGRGASCNFQLTPQAQEPALLQPCSLGLAILLMCKWETWMSRTWIPSTNPLVSCIVWRVVYWALSPSAYPTHSEGLLPCGTWTPTVRPHHQVLTACSLPALRRVTYSNSNSGPALACLNWQTSQLNHTFNQVWAPSRPSLGTPAQP